MRNIHTIVVGGGQAGLAMSRSLKDRGVDHVVFERGRIGERWRSERWDSLRLLTPNWQARLPGWAYDGPDRDGFMTREEVIVYLERYAASFSAEVEEDVTVTGIRRSGTRFLVTTEDGGSWSAANVVLASGECDQPNVPSLADRLTPEVEQVVPTRYKNPDQLRDGGVLVVGASATGVQLAAEIHASGRPVTLSVGRHTRLPRTYRGRDILWWLDRMGIFSQSAAEVRDLEASRAQPSLQLVGSEDHRSIDLGSLRAEGIRLTGQARSADGFRVAFADDLLETVVAADAKLMRQLRAIDDYVRRRGLEGYIPDPEPFELYDAPDGPGSLDLRAEGIRTVVWATGYRRSYPWLNVPVLDGHGELRHKGGITPVPGLYAMGLRFMRRRNSNFIDGVGDDARFVADHIAGRDRVGRAVA
jgi:putative flavoprotein involved in K+ transport